jgi:iron(III) transport system permease protein
VTPAGRLSLSAYRILVSDPELYRALLNTLIMAVGSTALALACGVPLAILATRTDLPLGKTVSLIALIPLITPPFIGALAWAILGAPRTGILNVAGRWLGAPGPWLNTYSLGGVIFTLGIYLSPYVFVLTSAVLSAMDPALEEAALVSGSRPRELFWRILLPLAIPGIASAGLIAFLDAVEQFGIPAILGRPANIFVLTTEIYRLMSRTPPDVAQVGAVSVVLLGLTGATVVLQYRAIGRRGYVTVTGKGFRQRRIPLKRWRVPALVLVWTYLAVAVGLPLLALVVSSLLKGGVVALTRNTFTLGHYPYLFTEYPAGVRSFVNGFLIAGGGATVALALAAVGAYAATRYASALSRLSRFILVLPLALPGIVIGSGLLLAYIRPPLVLYGTAWILMVSYITRFLPFGERAASASLLQVDRSLEEASAVGGASWAYTLRRILLPLIRPGLIGGWLLLFVAMIRELGTSVLLYSYGNEVPAVVLFDLWESGETGPMSAYAVVLIALTLAIVLGFKRFLRTDLAPSG